MKFTGGITIHKINAHAKGQRSTVNGQGHKGQSTFCPNLVFPGCNFSLNSPMAMTSCISLKWHRIGTLLFLRSFDKFQVRKGQKSADFYPNWSVPDCNSISNSPMSTKWYTMLAVAQKRCLIVFQSQISISQGMKQSPILSRFGHVRTISPVWIRRLPWMMHPVWSGIEEVPIVFHGHRSNFKDAWDNYIWMINIFIAYEDALYIRGLTVVILYKWCHTKYSAALLAWLLYVSLRMTVADMETWWREHIMRSSIDDTHVLESQSTAVHFVFCVFSHTKQWFV